MQNPARPYLYANNAESITGEGVELRVVGILYANENTTYGCLSSGIYYTEALTEYILEQNANSDIVNYVQEHGSITGTVYNGTSIGIYYDYEYTTYDGEVKTDTAFVGSSLGMSDLMSSMGGMGGSDGAGGMGGMGGASLNLASMKVISERSLGGNSTANSLYIYPVSFDSKDLVTDYLDRWNSDEDIVVGDVTLTAEDRSSVTHTDALELVINLINNMIDVVSAALIAFTSISLVVSTVMIGIITYVSVVERIKEIGVIRSLGGRKKDVSRLFTAETFIIGGLAGLIGVGVTYGISAIASIIVKALVGVPNIATLETSDAILMVVLSIVLTLFSGVMPARSAAKKDPVVALRTE